MLKNVQPNYFGFENTLQVSIDLSNSTWNTVASHEVFTVTGPVRHLVLYYISESLDSGGAAMISFGRAGAVTQYSAAQTYTNLTAGKLVLPGGTTLLNIGQWGAYFQRFDGTGTAADSANPTGNDLGYDVTAAALTDGTILAYCFWSALAPGGLVVAGAGGSL